MTVHKEGLACGLSQWPEAKWSSGPMNALMDGTAPKALPGILSKLRTAGLRMVCVFPRARVTSNGETVGLYSVTKAKALVDDYLHYCSPAQLANYASDHTLLGFSAGDDFSNASVWGGKEVTPAQAYEVVHYAKQRFGATVPVGLRQTPAWISGGSALSGVVDFGWAQWLGARGDPKVFYDKAWAIASRLGFKMAGGLNVHSCSHAGLDDPCAPSVLWNTGCIAEDHPGISAFISWRYDVDDWHKLGDTWAKLAERASTRPKRSLLRGA